MSIDCACSLVKSGKHRWFGHIERKGKESTFEDGLQGWRGSTGKSWFEGGCKKDGFEKERWHIEVPNNQ